MRVSDHPRLDKQEIRQMADAEFAALGIRLVNRTDVVLKCVKCGEAWAPQLDSDGKLPFDYWVCPVRCNAERAKSSRA